MIFVPAGKRIYITKGENSIVNDNVPMELSEDITLSLSSSFSPLFGGGDTKFLNFLGAGARRFNENIAFSGQFKQLGYQQWDKTDPLSFTTTITFNMGAAGWNDGQTEVYNPTIALAKLPLPEEGGLGGSLIGPGPTPDQLIDGEKVGIKSKVLTIQIGRVIRISPIIVKRAEPMFSNETDDRGYPIWSRITLDIQSLFTATVKMIKNREGEDEV